MRKYLAIIIFILCLIFSNNCLFAANQSREMVPENKEGVYMPVSFTELFNNVEKFNKKAGDNIRLALQTQNYNTELTNRNGANKSINISSFTEKCFPCAELAAVNTGNEKMLNDSYEILNKYYEAIGGLDKVKAEKNSYCEGTIELAGLKGTYKLWREGSSFERSEVDLGVLKYSSGSNGQLIWQMDSNGKLHIEKNEKALKEKRVDELLKSYEHLNPQSKDFKVTFEGIQKIGLIDCYVIKINNNINEDVRFEYINTSNFYLEKTVIKSIDFETHTIFSDYHDVNGVKHAFKQEIETLPIKRTQVIQITKYESNLKMDTSSFNPPKEVADFQFINGKNSENIPIQYAADHIFMTVKINGQESLWCLDSGASVSVIDLEYGKRLGLESKGNRNIGGMGKTFQNSFVEIPSYSVQGIHFKEQKIISLNGLSKIIKEMGLETEVTGVLGYDFLSRFVTKLDIANRKVSFYMPDKFKYEGPGKVIDAPVQGNVFYLPMTIDAKYSGKWLLDLGASATMINYPFAEQNELHKLKGIDIISEGAGGNFTVKVVKFKTVELSGFLVNENLAAISFGKEGNVGRKERAGTIGNQIFRHLIIYLDYNKQQVILEKGKDFDKIFPVNKSGLMLKLSDSGDITVFYVPANTPAFEAGFKKGDIVTAINNANIKSFGGLLPVVDLLKEKAGTEYKFTILRDGQTKQINLKLKDLF